MTSFASRDKLIAAVRQHYAPSFRHHASVAAALQPFVLHERRVTTPLETALDFLFMQAYKAHDALVVVAENGLAEDAATVTRRLLEIAIQAVYIGADSETSECDKRAGRYLAFLWRETPDNAKQVLSPEARDHWSAIADKHGKDIPADATRWGPSFWAMFKYAEQEDTYREDYTLLSRIAHGSPEEFFLHYSADKVRLRFSVHIPAVLRFGTRYYAGAASVWNRHFRIIDDTRMSEIIRQALEEEHDAGAT